MQTEINKHILSVPEGSYGFKVLAAREETGWVQSLFYTVRTNYAGDSNNFGHSVIHHEDTDLPEGEWEISKIEKQRVYLTRHRAGSR